MTVARKSTDECECMDPDARKRAFGSLRILPSGRHQARYRDTTGKMHNAEMTFTTHKLAAAYLDRVHTDLQRDVWVDPATVKPAAPTLREYAEGWLKHHDVRTRTQLNYRQLLDSRILPKLGDLPIDSITPGTVRKWFDTIGEDGHLVARAHAYTLLRTVLNAAVADETIATQPCRIRGGGSTPPTRPIEPATLTEIDAIAAAMPARLRMSVQLAAWLGVRRGELLELRRSDIDMKDGVVKVRRSVGQVKGGRFVGPPKSAAGVRDIAIPPHLLPALKDHLRDHVLWSADALLFTAEGGGYLPTSTHYEAFDAARQAAGRPNLRWHDLRHTGATLAAGTGASLKDIMSRIGHSSVSAALAYQHASSSADRLLADRLSALVTASTEAATS